MKAFVGICVLMGLHVLPEMRDYWSTDKAVGVPFVNNIMTLARFEAIRKNLHFSNNWDATPNDRAYKIQAVLDHFNMHFQDAISPSKSHSIDERMIKFKGHNIMKQYIKNKPSVRWGFKMWVRASAKTGYVFESHLYTGKKPDEFSDSSHTLGESVVLQLSQNIRDKGCVLAFDNFFSSVPLMEKLHEYGIKSVATIRKNKKHLPQLKTDAAMKSGETFGTVQSNGKVAFIQWKDRRCVYAVSNYLTPHGATSKQRKVKGSAQKAEVDIPIMIAMYNCYMGGVDISDQRKECYEIDHRSRYKYYLKLFFDQTDTAISNAYIVYKQMKDVPSMSSKDFRLKIVHGLVGQFSSRSKPRFESAKSKKRKLLQPSSNGIPHLPIVKSNRARCTFCSSNENDCRSNVFCRICDVALCLNSQRNCYSCYHE